MLLITGMRLRTLLSGVLIAGLLLPTLALGAQPARAAFNDDDTPTYGMHTHFAWDGSLHDVEVDLDRMKAAGMLAAKFDVSWKEMEPRNGNWNEAYVKRLDAVVELMDARGIRPIIMFWETPDWAHRDGETDCVVEGEEAYKIAYIPPDEDKIDDWGQAFRYLARRYNPVERPGELEMAYEVWNEPNIYAWWCARIWDAGGKERSIKRYVRMLKAAYTEIKSVDPDAVVLGGAIAFNDNGYLQKMYEYGAKGSFDAIALHPYTQYKAHGPDWMDPARRGYYSFNRAVVEMYGVMTANGEPEKKIWITEIGWSLGRDNKTYMTEDERAQHYRRAVAMVQGWPFVHVFLGFVMHENRQEDFELYPLNGAPSGTWLAFADAVSRAPKPGIDGDGPENVSLVINQGPNGGAELTRNRVVTLSTAATDATSAVASMRFSSDGIEWSEWYIYGPTAKWTLPPGAGTRAVYVQYLDQAHNKSRTVGDTIVLDAAPPTGAISLARGAEATRYSAVTLSLRGVKDEGQGLRDMRFSDDKQTWSRWEPFARSKSWTLPGGEGVKTVYAQVRDNARNSATFSDTIVRDTTAPRGVSPSSAVAGKASVQGGAAPVLVSWPTARADAGSGTAGYELEQRAGRGRWKAVRLEDRKASSATLLLRPGNYTVRVRTFDAAGNRSAWTSTSAAVGAYQETSASVEYVGGWTKSKVKGAFGGSVKRTATARRAARLTATSKSLAWVSTLGPNRGKALVLVDGKRAGVVDLYSAKLTPARVVFSRAWGAAGKHTVEIRVLGTRNGSSGGARVDLDALVSLR